MVRAILEGRKTQTRRIIKGDIVSRPSAGGVRKLFSLADPIDLGDVSRILKASNEPYNPHRDICPYGKPGDRLWVRETWRLYDSLVECACYDACECSRHHGKPLYRASLPDNEGPWKPSIHMPRWASRITLEVTEVRVERLKDISRGDCMAEGCPFPNVAGVFNPVAWYWALWSTINGPESWHANPWVWVIEFKRVNQEVSAA
jgi:hypothetical protein